MKTFQFNYKATFEGTVDVRADSKEEAKKILEENFSLVSPTISANYESEGFDDDGISDWDFNTHPVKVVINKQ